MKKSLSLVAASLVVGLGFGACSATKEEAKPMMMMPKVADSKYDVKFAGIHAPVTDMEKRENHAAPSVMVNGTKYDLKYGLIGRTGDHFKSGVFGRILNQKGEPIMIGGDAWDAASMDHTTLLPRLDKSGQQRLFAVTHFESAPAAMYMTELYQDSSSGKLISADTHHVNFRDSGGLWIPCAGMRTPWLTHLGSEEYEPDAKLVEMGKGDKVYKWNQMLRYFEDPSMANPYDYGWTPEVDVVYNKKTKKYEPKTAKHYSMGRFAHELAYVMPDNRTVYLSDDGTNVGLFMFVADKPGDLSAGQLYAAKWVQKSTKNGGQADLKWLSMGWADNEMIKEALDAKLTFSDMFATAEPKDGQCPDKFKSVNTTTGHECLKLKENEDFDIRALATRMETRRMAGYMDATTEFRKEEGITFDERTNTLFVAMSEVARGMEDNMKNGKASSRYDKGSSNDVKVPYNKCGVVYSLDTKGDVWAYFNKNEGKNKKPSMKKIMEIDSDYVAVNMNGLVAGVPSNNEGTPYEGANKCHIDSIAQPDNVTMIEKSNTLIIGEDTGSGHQNDAVWAYDLKTKKLTRIFTTPYGSETTSPYWYKDVNGHGYMIVVTQHPYGESDAVYSRNHNDPNGIANLVRSPRDLDGYVGYIYGFPAMR